MSDMLTLKELGFELRTVEQEKSQYVRVPTPGAPSENPLTHQGTPEIPSDVRTKMIERFDSDSFTDESFHDLWLRGNPIVVHGLCSKFKRKWSPSFFIEHYGKETCIIVDCQTDKREETTVAEFFASFGKYKGREGCWKLKVFAHCILVVP